MADAKTVDILMVAALQDELDAFLHTAESWKTHQDRHGQPYFTRDVPQTHGRALSIAAACSGMGETATTARVTALIAHLNPALIVMCGICAGKRGSVRLGDIIVAERVYSYDDGKLIQSLTGDGIDAAFLPNIKTYNLPSSRHNEIELSAKSWANSEIPPRPLELQKDWVLCALLDAEHNRGAPPITHADRKTYYPDWKPIIQSLREQAFVVVNDGALCLTATGRKRAGEFLLLHPDGFPQIEPSSVHFGAIATGKTVRQDEMLFDHLERLTRKTIGVDMEAAAIGVVAEFTHRPWVVVKAVSDHADSEKDDRYRHFACRASAQFVLEILEKHGPEWVRQARHEEPKYEDDASRQASAHLNQLEKRRQEARAEGQSTTDIDMQIVDLKRVMRRGGMLHPGDILNSRYQLLDKLGEGGFATVWKALDLEQTATVALKALHPHLASERQRIDRFRRGAREMAALERIRMDEH